MTEKSLQGFWVDLLPGHQKGQAANPPVQGIYSLLPDHTILIFQRSKQNDRYFVSTFVTSYFITRLSEMSAALAAVAFSFMATL